MKPNPALPQVAREDIIRQLEQFSAEVLEAALGVLRARETAAREAEEAESG